MTYYQFIHEVEVKGEEQRDKETWIDDRTERDQYLSDDLSGGILSAVSGRKFGGAYCRGDLKAV